MFTYQPRKLPSWFVNRNVENGLPFSVRRSWPRARTRLLYVQSAKRSVPIAYVLCGGSQRIVRCGPSSTTRVGAAFQTRLRNS
jgi:hypothetical protein